MTSLRRQAVATDRKTNQHVYVAGDWFSVNGCDPVPVPEAMRGQPPKAIAMQLLTRLLEKFKD